MTPARPGCRGNRGNRWTAAVALMVMTVITACGSSAPTAAPLPVPASVPASSLPSAASTDQSAPTNQREPRVLLIGDSTLLAVDRYNGYRALNGFEYTFDAESCRTLGIPSCGERPVPPNAVEAIRAASGTFDDVLVMAGYDEWWTSFPKSFDAVVEAARAKGARHIIWLTYREGVKYKLPSGDLADEAFVRNNQTLRDKVASGVYPDVRLAQWYPHTARDMGWISRDGIHLTLKGALGVADYISRWVAHVEGLPCPVPREPGGAIETVCSNPDTQPPVAEVTELYKT